MNMIKLFEDVLRNCIVGKMFVGVGVDFDRCLQVCMANTPEHIRK
jgi:hypothetical protein